MHLPSRAAPVCSNDACVCTCLVTHTVCLCVCVFTCVCACLHACLLTVPLLVLPSAACCSVTKLNSTMGQVLCSVRHMVLPCKSVT